MTASDMTYHTLLARHDAMRLRRQLLSPAAEARRGRESLAEPYDGAADQAVILRHMEAVAPIEELIRDLYRSLFGRHPSLRTLFPADMAFQQEHLGRAFHYLIEHLGRPERITETFTRLGRDHRKLGVRQAHYAAFEEALCEALRARAGERRSTELEDAWRRMLRLGVTAMVRGAEEALHEPPCWRATVMDHWTHGPHHAVLRVRPHEPFRYRAGQYASVETARLPHTWRPYYLAPAPGPDGDLELHVRRTGPGGVSEALAHHTAPGDELRIGPPRGNLTLADEPTGGLRLVCWDTGWAAMKALLRELDARPRPVRLLLGTETPADLYDAACLSTIEHRRPWLTVIPVTDSPSPEAGYGRLALQAAAGGPLPDDRVLLCGPAAMARAVTAALTRAGLPADRIHHDPYRAG